MNKFAKVSTCLSVSLALSFVAGCAAHSSNRPVANSVCIDVPLRTSHEIEYLRRMTSRYLLDRGFRLADEACDVSVRYRPFDDVNAELILGYGGDWTGRLSQEGTLDITYQGRSLVRDQFVALRGSDSVPALLDQLARVMVEPVVSRFAPLMASDGK